MLRGLTRTARLSLAISVLALLAAGGVSYAASRGGEVAACVHKHGGGLYVGKCAKHDKKLSWGKVGATGPRGLQGPQGGQGIAGPTGPLSTTVPSGQTVRGVFNLDNVAAKAEQFNGASISFGMSLASAPAVQIIPAGGPTTTSCPGTLANPTAAGGFLCIYEESIDNVKHVEVCEVGCGRPSSANRFGAEMFAEATAVGRFFVDGSWAVTAP